VPLKTLGTESDLNEALELMVANEVNQLPVVRDGRLLGMLRRGDVMRYMQLGVTSCTSTNPTSHARDPNRNGDCSRLARCTA
jgi:signal-transduction protein with cAMP-binding, CBS, and nucleotidyltransferase domain